MTVDEFRALALSLPQAIEKPHFERASFRVDAPRGKTIATLLEQDASANVFLTVEEQEMLIGAEPNVFSKVPNKWGDKGATTIALSAVDETTALSALKMSWRHAAPPKLQDLLE
ncbi:MAG: MmcQ/YjbR family DNA-binding protein [Hyphomonadaceae bacterium]|nr:MmcQ/YjbR family DNA-binding protein [Hyphomonadaceae bacterium]